MGAFYNESQNCLFLCGLCVLVVFAFDRRLIALPDFNRFIFTSTNQSFAIGTKT
jgi:hypothetical protein